MAEDDEYTVASPDDRRRVLFAGSEADAVKFLDANFPWPHSDGNRLVHSAVLISPDGKTHRTYHREEGLSEPFDKDWEPVPSSSSVQDAYVPSEDAVIDPPVVNSPFTPLS